VSASKIARREAIVAMTVAGRSQAEIAAAINGGVRTVRRWQRDPEVVEAVTAAAKARQQNAVAELDKLRTKACAVLDELLDDGEARVRLHAVKLTVEHNVAQRRLADDDRVVAMEAALSQLEDRTRRSGWFR
jgi:transposase